MVIRPRFPRMRYSLVIPVTSGHLLFQAFAAAGTAVRAILAILVVAFTEGIVLCFLDHDAFSVHKGFRHNAGDDADSSSASVGTGISSKSYFMVEYPFIQNFLGIQPVKQRELHAGSGQLRGVVVGDQQLRVLFSVFVSLRNVG